jgi:hypothetical protein
MRSKIISGALLALVLVFSACKKDNSSTDPVIKPTHGNVTAKIDGVTFQPTDAGRWQVLIRTIFCYQQLMPRIIVYPSPDPLRQVRSQVLPMMRPPVFTLAKMVRCGCPPWVARLP